MLCDWRFPLARPGVLAVLAVALLGMVAASISTPASAEGLSDLAIERLVLSPSTARAGDTVIAAVFVTNRGSAASPAVTGALHLAASTAAPLEPAAAVATFGIDPLAPGAWAQIAVPFIVPAMDPGALYAIVQVDAAAEVSELTETNNRLAARLLIAVPDLVVSRVWMTPATARPGDTVTLGLNVSNAGRVPAAPTSVSVYVTGSSSAPLDGLAPLATIDVPEIEPSRTASQSVPVALPDLAPGVYYAVAVVDSAGAVAETNEANNRRASRFQVALPDLAVTRATVTPGLARPGDPARVSVRVQNWGSVPAVASQLALYVLANPASPVDGVPPAATTDIPAIPPRRAVEVAVPVTLPMVAPGIYYAVAVVDPGAAVSETNEANNRGAGRFEVARPDLTIDSLVVTPALVSPGQTATATVRIRNRGRVPSYSTTGDVFLATSEGAEPASGLSHTQLSLTPVAPGRTTTYAVPLTVPTLDPGAYYVIGQVDASTATSVLTTMAAATSTASVSTSRPRKSVKLRVALPDLVVSELSVNSTALRPGTIMSVVLTVKNAGASVAASTLTALLFGACADSGGLALKTVAVPLLSAGASVRTTVTTTVPSVAPGSYCLTARADSGGVVRESIETNNHTTTPVSVAATTATLVPYVDPTQLDVPWPKHSHYKQPWRAWLETVPARNLRQGLGIDYSWNTLRESDAVAMRFLAESGFSRVRVEVPWGEVDYDTLDLRPEAKAHLTEIITAGKSNGIRPLILLNAHHGVGVPARQFTRTVATNASRGSRTLVLNDVTGIAPNYTGLSNLSSYWMAEVLITGVNPSTRTVTLSKPLPVSLGAGVPVTLHTIRYLPLYEPGMSQYDATVEGWLRYVRTVATAVLDAGVTHFDVEIWNELTFGSAFLSINNYYDPEVVTEGAWPFGPGGRVWELARRTVEMLAVEFPSITPIWGFSNTWFFMNPASDLPPGIRGQTYHPYHPDYRGPEDEQDGLQANLEGYAPQYRAFFPEFFGTFLWTESLTRRINPKERVRRPPGSVEFDHYITEYGLDPRDMGVSDADLARELKARAMLRSALFWLNKGIRALWFYTDLDEGSFELLHPGVAELPLYPADPGVYFTPAMTALRNTREFFGDADFSGPARQLDVQLAAADGQGGGIIFEGDGTHPALTYQDVLAVLPFQSDERTFVLALYVMTRNALEKIAPVQFLIRVTNVDGDAVQVDYLDPLGGVMLTAEVVDRTPDSVTVKVPVADYPYLLRLRE
jgi:subtilase family serine protease